LLISSFQEGETPDERRSSIRFKRFESALFLLLRRRVSTERSHYNVFRVAASRAFFDFSPPKSSFCADVFFRSFRSGEIFSSRLVKIARRRKIERGPLETPPDAT